MQPQGAITLFILCCVAQSAQDGYGYLIPRNPVRVVGESITFECKSPEGFTNNFQSPAMFLWHNGKRLPQLQHSVEGTALKAKHVLVNITMQDAGNWSCIIIDAQKNTTEKFFTQNLVVIKGNATHIIGEDGKSVNIRCLDETDKVQPVKVVLLVDEENTTSLTLNLKLKDGNKTIYCKVCSNTPTGDDNSCTAIKKPLTVVEFKQYQQDHQHLYNITLCGETKNLNVFLVNGTEESSLTGVNNAQGCVVYTWTSVTDHGRVCIRHDGHELCKNLSVFEPSELKNSENSEGLGGGAIAGILLGVLAGVAVIIGIYIWRKRKERNSKPNKKDTKDQIEGVDVPLQQRPPEEQGISPEAEVLIQKQQEQQQSNENEKTPGEAEEPIQEQQKQQQQSNKDKKAPCGCFNVSKRNSECKAEEPIQEQQKQQQQTNKDKKAPCGCFNVSKRNSECKEEMHGHVQEEGDQSPPAHRK